MERKQEEAGSLEKGNKEQEANKGTRKGYQRIKSWKCPGSKGKRSFLERDAFCQY